MKRFLTLLAFFALLLTSRAVQAQATLGQTVGTFPFAPSKVLADPFRDQVYATVPADNTVRIIDTQNIGVDTIIQLPVGSIPVDMALSPDHNLLYVANSGSTVNAINVIDLTVPPSQLPNPLPVITLPGPGLAVAAAVDNFIYVLSRVTILQVDDKGKTTVVVTTPTFRINAADPTAPPTSIGENNVTHTLLQASPDGATVLLTSSLGLEQFDAATGDRLAVDPDLAKNAVQLIISNTGKYLCAPDPAGNGVATPFTTLLFAANDVTAFYGTFSDPATPGPLAFSFANDLDGSDADSIVYQLRFSSTGPELLVFDTATFLETASVPLATNGLTINVASRNSIALDRTDSLLFISTTSSNDINAPGQLLIITTGTGTINPFQPPTITTTSLPDGMTAQFYTAPPITATLFPTSFGASGLPPGLTIDPTTGIISGTTFQAGVYPVTLSASNQYGTGTSVVTLTITGMTFLPPEINSPTTATAMIGVPFIYQITAINNPTSFNAAGLPAGLAINTTTGLISGTPTAAGSFLVFLGASNVAGTGTAQLGLTVVPIPIPVITSPTTATGVIGEVFTYQITAINNPTRFGATGLPAGFTINAFTGVITGTPVVAGTFIFELSASNTGGTGTSAVTVSVAPLPAPVITSPAATTALVGQAFNYQITATNTPVSFSAGGLPPGLTVNTVSGLISGTPLVAGTFAVTVGATNSSATGTAPLSLSITSNLPIIDVIAAVPRVTAGTGDTGAITITRTGDLTQRLVVAYSIRGSARNGTDYIGGRAGTEFKALTGTVTIKPNKSQVTLRILPTGDQGGVSPRTVKLSLLSAVTYQRGAATNGKVKIISGE